MSDLELAVESALSALEVQGFPRELVVLGITRSKKDEFPDGSVEYVTHVGSQTDKNDAILLELVVRDLREEVEFQAQATIYEKDCPKCGSSRFCLENVPAEGGTRYRIKQIERCMDCKHEQRREQ